MLVALNDLASHKAKPTEAKKREAQHLLDYAAAHPLAIVLYYASDMVLQIDSDAAYLVLPGVKSWILGYYQLINTNEYVYFPNNVNGVILVECKKLRHVVASEAEAETIGLLHNAQIGIIIRKYLEDLGNKQTSRWFKHW